MKMNKKELRRKVYGKYKGKCAYCGCELPERWHIDHIHPKNRNGNESVSNFNPSCPSCNINKRVMTIPEFRNWIEKTNIEVLNKLSAQYRISKKFGIIKETDMRVVFYFEKNEMENRKQKNLNNKDLFKEERKNEFKKKWSKNI